jgi:hypothetical protein
MGSTACSAAPKVNTNSPNSSFMRKNSNVSDTATKLLEKLKGESINILIEISPDNDYFERLKSVEWFVDNLNREGCKATLENVKVLHRKKGEFYINIVDPEKKEKKIVFSSSDSHVDVVTGSLVNKKNYYLILNNIVEYLDKKRT